MKNIQTTVYSLVTLVLETLATEHCKHSSAFKIQNPNMLKKSVANNCSSVNDWQSLTSWNKNKLSTLIFLYTCICYF